MANTGNTQQQINYGATANDGQGDPLRTAFIKTDNNFDNVWLAGPVGSNITITNNSLTVNNTNGNLVLSPNGVGVIQTNNHVLPRANNTFALGSTNLRYRGVYVGVEGINTTGTTVTNPVPLANLNLTSGARAFVNDANLVAAGNFGVQVSGGGSNVCPVWSDGANWFIG